MENKFSFSNNWNGKLNNECFTTIRLSGRFNVGMIIDIELKGRSMGPAKVLDRKRLTLDQINDWMAFLDTDYPAKECRDILKRMHHGVPDWSNQPLYYYLLKYVKTDQKKPSTETLLP